MHARYAGNNHTRREAAGGKDGREWRAHWYGACGVGYSSAKDKLTTTASQNNHYATVVHEQSLEMLEALISSAEDWKMLAVPVDLSMCGKVYSLFLVLQGCNLGRAPRPFLSRG